MTIAGLPGAFAFAFTLALAMPAWAQDLIYSDAATRACLQGAPDSVAQEGCIGASARACMGATDAGGSTYGMSGCLERELTYWDGLLNAYYEVAIVRARKMDAETRTFSPGAAFAEQALREMQRAWIPFRDAACEFARAQYGAGTGAGGAALSCHMDMTGKQALALGRFGYGQ